jgi:hypothetical protein
LLRPAPSADENEILDAISASIDALVVLIEQGPERAKTQLHSRGIEPRAYKKDGSASPSED